MGSDGQTDGDLVHYTKIMLVPDNSLVIIFYQEPTHIRVPSNENGKRYGRILRAYKKNVIPVSFTSTMEKKKKEYQISHWILTNSSYIFSFFVCFFFEVFRR